LVSPGPASAAILVRITIIVVFEILDANPELGSTAAASEARVNRSEFYDGFLEGSHS
jgi:hypothetical protein